jgi:PAS domain S-box-containing protein
MDPTVLVVDDEQLTWLWTETLLKKRGFSPLFACSGEECLRLLETGAAPEAVLMDIDLGETELDGTETARRIIDGYHLPVVFFTGHEDEETISKCRGIRAFGIVPKNTDSDEFLVSALCMAICLHESETALKRSEEKFRTIFDNSPVGFFRSTTEGRFIDVNPALAEMLGYESPQEVLDNIYDIGEQIYVRGEKRDDIVDETLQEKGISRYQNVYRRRDGSHFHANLILKAVRDDEGNLLFLEGIVEDTTKQQEMERERRLLLMEMNHRIKNNLFTVEALAKIELSNETKSKDEAIADIISRVQAIGLIHQKLYSSGDYLTIDAEGYLRDVVTGICGMISSEECRYIPELRIANIQLPSKKMMNLGIITVELLNNTAKYAGVSGSCTVGVVLKKEGGEAVLEYRDDGRGIDPPDSITDGMKSGSGLMLIETLAKDLGGVLEILPNTGREGGAGKKGGREKGGGKRAGRGKSGFRLRLRFPLDS